MQLFLLLASACLQLLAAVEQSDSNHLGRITKDDYLVDEETGLALHPRLEGDAMQALLAQVRPGGQTVLVYPLRACDSERAGQPGSEQPLLERAPPLFGWFVRALFSVVRLPLSGNYLTAGDTQQHPLTVGFGLPLQELYGAPVGKRASKATVRVHRSAVLLF